MRVLLVDPGGTKRRHLAAGLRQAGLEVSEAKDLREAEVKVRAGLPDMAIFVVDDDPIESFTLAGKLRTWNPEIMLFVASGPEAADRQYLKAQYDADGYVERPYVLDDVLDTMSGASGLANYEDLRSGFFSQPAGTPLRAAK